MIKAIYHAPLSQYKLIKELGFNSCEIMCKALNYSVEAVQERIDALHNLGMFAIIDPGFDEDLIKDSMSSKATEILAKIKTDLEDIIYLCDEPNLRDIHPALIHLWDGISKNSLPKNRTMIVLGWTRSYCDYENKADIVGLDFYKKSTHDPLGTIKLILKAKYFQLKHAGELVAVPAIKYSPSFIKQEHYLWTKIIGIKDFMWYSFTPNEENPPWFDKDLSQLEEIKETLKKLNT